jgi:hypothetical protein
MSTPKRTKTTTKTSAKAAAKKPAPQKAAKAAPKKSAKKNAAKAPAKPAKKAVKAPKQTVANKVAKKVAKIISKVLAKKKGAAKSATAAKTPAATPVKKTLKSVMRDASKKVAKTVGAVRKAAAKGATAKSASKTATTKNGTAAKAAPKAPAKQTRPAAPARRPKSFAPRDVERGFGFPADVPELPGLYGEDRLVLMTKDPEYLFAYWEVTPEKLASGEKVKRRGEEYREALRLNWASRDIFERNFAVLPVSLGARKWYLRVPFSGLAYQVEIGWLGETGHFISLLTSNPSDAPESWNATRRRLKDAAGKGGVLGRTLAAGKPQGSSDLSAPASPEADSAMLAPWAFTGPGSQASSFGSAKKPGRGSSV